MDGSSRATTRAAGRHGDGGTEPTVLDAPGELAAVSLDDLVAFRAAIILAEEALGRALLAIQRHEGNDSALAREIGSALEALATTEDDLRRAAIPRNPEPHPERPSSEPG